MPQWNAPNSICLHKIPTIVKHWKPFSQVSPCRSPFWRGHHSFGKSAFSCLHSQYVEQGIQSCILWRIQPNHMLWMRMIMMATVIWWGGMWVGSQTEVYLGSAGTRCAQCARRYTWNTTPCAPWHTAGPPWARGFSDILNQGLHRRRPTPKYPS